MPVHRPHFRRCDAYIVVAPIRLSSNTVLEVGDEVSRDDYGVFQLRRWYRHRWIGPKDHPWTNAKLEDPRSRPECFGVGNLSDKKPPKKTPAKKATARKTAAKKSAKAEASEAGVEKPWEANSSAS